MNRVVRKLLITWYCEGHQLKKKKMSITRSTRKGKWEMWSFLESQKERGPLISGICNKIGLIIMCEIVDWINLVQNREQWFAPVNTVVKFFLARHLHCFKYRYAPHNDVSVNDGPYIRRWSHKIIIL